MQHRALYLRLLALTLPFTLNGCEWANTHMPVIGERCENWQCFTDSGQQQSKLAEQERQQREAAKANAPQQTGATPPAQPAVPYVPLAPASPESPTYSYVPRAAPAPGTTPYDGRVNP